MNIVPLRCFGDWQRLGSDQAVKPRVVQFGTLQSEAITGNSMADWAQIQGSNKRKIFHFTETGREWAMVFPWLVKNRKHRRLRASNVNKSRFSQRGERSN